MSLWWIVFAVALSALGLVLSVGVGIYSYYHWRIRYHMKQLERLAREERELYNELDSAVREMSQENRE